MCGTPGIYQYARNDMPPESGSLALVFNGDISNFKTLQKQLVKRGHRLGIKPLDYSGIVCAGCASAQSGPAESQLTPNLAETYRL
jgi:glutamine phosphoribosylpyrophosphate amidotransferase